MSMRRPSHLQYVIAQPRRASIALRAHRIQNHFSRRRRSSPAARTHVTAPTTTPAEPSFGWIVSGVFATGIGFYITQLVVAARRGCSDPSVADISKQKDVAARYETTADNFDTEVGMSELLMGINRQRRVLARQCSGHVLEVSCGTGRNLGYFDLGRNGRVDSLTLVDLSPAMIDVCRRKWAVLMAEREKSPATALKPGLVVRFLAGSALDPMPTPPPSTQTDPAVKASGKYDTIIQTMGLCSTPEPAELLLNLAAHLDTANPDARLLLLEHGRSYAEWLNGILDGSAVQHAERHGCWFNREIGELVRRAADEAGLEVVRERRRHLGTTWIFELRPGDELVRRSKEGTGKIAEVSLPSVKSENSWRAWLGLR